MAAYVMATLTASVVIQLTSVVSITCMCNLVPGEINEWPKWLLYKWHCRWCRL